MEIKEVKKNLYVANDGTVFEKEDECVRYEHKKYIKECVKYVTDHSIAMWYDEWSGIAGYFGSGGCTLFLIEVDETLCGFGKEFLARPVVDDLNDFLGEKVFIRCEGECIDSEWYVEGTLDDAIADMQDAVRALKSWKEE